MVDWADAATVPVIQISKQTVSVFIFKLLHALSSHAAHWANTVCGRRSVRCASRDANHSGVKCARNIGRARLSAL
jgi:hypothetical protein